MQKTIDGLLIALAVALGAISITVIFAANKSLAANQFFFWIFGLFVMYVASHMFHITWQKYALLLYVISIAALLLVFLFGVQVRGSVRWIDLGVFRFQPSEIAKVATVVLLANYFVKRTAANLNSLIFSILLILPVFAMIFLQPDFGSALAISAIWLGITFAAGIQKKHIVLLIIATITLSMFGYEILAPYQKARIATFLNPGIDPLGSGYNIIQSKIAVGSGQLVGRGLGLGSQSQLNFLPEAESDFIFASIAEQLGFLGAGLVIILSGAYLATLSTYLKNAERFNRLVIAGSLSLFLYQFTVNIGMNMGILPVTGITLPFVSYGGSSLISMLLLLGIIFSTRTKNY